MAELDDALERRRLTEARESAARRLGQAVAKYELRYGVSVWPSSMIPDAEVAPFADFFRVLDDRGGLSGFAGDPVVYRGTYSSPMMTVQAVTIEGAPFLVWPHPTAFYDKKSGEFRLHSSTRRWVAGFGGPETRRYKAERARTDRVRKKRLKDLGPHIPAFLITCAYLGPDALGSFVFVFTEDLRCAWTSGSGHFPRRELHPVDDLLVALLP